MVHIRDEGVFDAPLEKIWKYIGDDTPGLHKHRAIPSTKVLSEEGNVVVQEMQMLNADGKGTHWETWRLTMNPPRGYQVEAIAGPTKFLDAGVLLIGGHPTAKSVPPIVRQKDGRYQTRLAGGTRDNLTEAELGPIEKAVADSGPYPVRLSEDEYARLRADPEKVDALFIDRMIDQIRRWTDMAEKHRAPLDIPLFWLGGNDDKPQALIHASSTPHVHFIDEKVVRLDNDHEILGFGWTNPSPWNTPRELSEDRLAERLAPLLHRVEGPPPAVYPL